MKVIQFKRHDNCINCNSDRSIELYDVYNKPVNYSYFLDNISRIDIDCFNKRELSYMKCKKCGKIYNINWVNGIPEPLINKNTLFIFINNIFKKYK